MSQTNLSRPLTTADPTGSVAPHPTNIRSTRPASFFKARTGLMLLTASFIMGLPFLLAAFQAQDVLFLSNQHANLVEKALLATDRGRVELIGFVYPPLPFLLILLSAQPLLPSLLGALVGGATVWLLWLRLGRLPFPLAIRVALLLIPMSVPSTLFLATQSLSEMMLLFLMVVVWNSFVAFTHGSETRAGFMAGLALGLAFMVNHYALLYAVAFALSVPLFLPKDTPLAKRNGAALSGALVLIFPVVVMVFTWSYVNWLFTGNPFYYLTNPANRVFVYLNPALNSAVVGWDLAFQATLQDLLVAPLYPLVGALVAWQRPGRLLLYLAPVGLVVVSRAAGVVYPDYFAVSTFTIMALVAIPRRTPARLWPLLLLAAFLHLAAGYGTPIHDEVAVWGSTMLANRPAVNDVEEKEIGKYLRQLPQGSVLLDDRDGYRLVARAGTARPFLLPADPLYSVAISRPARFVTYIVQPNPEGDRRLNSNVYGLSSVAPEGYRLKAVWPHWFLYERV